MPTSAASSTSSRSNISWPLPASALNPGAGSASRSGSRCAPGGRGQGSGKLKDVRSTPAELTPDPSPLTPASRGLFITLEGPEGGGKSTLAPLLADHLRARGHQVVTCAEPGGGAIPQAIRALLLHPDRVEMAPRTELLLFLAARAQQIQDTIAPALEAGGT